MSPHKREIYVKGKGWITEDFCTKETFVVRQPNDTKTYEIWEDTGGNLYWVMLNQKVHSQIEADKTWTEVILDYTQQNNWIIETFSFNSQYCVTKYYPNYYPNVINEGSADLYSFEDYEKRVMAHYYMFGNPYKDQYFDGIKGVEQLSLSPNKTQNREAFYVEAIRQHELFSASTGCHFDDIDPNNFLVDEKFEDIKIIDVCSWAPGHIKDQPQHSDPLATTWPLAEHRIIGPVWSDVFLKNAYNS